MSDIKLDEKIQKKLNQRPFEREVQLSLERNRWFLISCLLSIVCFLCVVLALYQKQSENDKIKVAWIKMLPSGSWETDFSDEDREPEFFPATIDYLIRDFVIKRYSKLKGTISADYSIAAYFMGPDLMKEFYLEAPKIANDHESCSTCDQVSIQIRGIHHYERHLNLVKNRTENSYRTNIYITESTTSSDGQSTKKLNKIIAILWRLKSKEEVYSKKSLLKNNPIGLEIISSDIRDDFDQGVSS